MERCFEVTWRHRLVADRYECQTLKQFLKTENRYPCQLVGKFFLLESKKQMKVPHVLHLVFVVIIAYSQKAM